MIKEVKKMIKRWVCSCVLEFGHPAPKCKFCGGRGYCEEDVEDEMSGDKNEHKSKRC